MSDLRYFGLITDTAVAPRLTLEHWWGLLLLVSFLYLGQYHLGSWVGSEVGMSPC